MLHDTRFILPCAGLIAALMANPADAQVVSNYWDNNGLATPSSGVWDNSMPNWTTTSNLTEITVPFTSGAFAIFAAGSSVIPTPMTITVPAATTVICAGLTTDPVSGTGGVVSNMTFNMGGAGAAISLGTTGQQGVFGPTGGVIQFNIPLVGVGGGMVVENGSTVILNATNTYSGGGTVIGANSTLVLGPTGLLNSTGGVYSGTLPNSGTLVFSNDTSSITFTGTHAISGSGNVYVVNCAAVSGGTAPAGQVTMEAVNGNTYTGITAITNGYLLITNDTEFGAPPATLVPNQLMMNMPLDGHIYGVRLQYQAAITLNANRGIYLGASGSSGNGFVGGAFNASSGDTLTIAGPINGPGSFSAGCNASFGNGTILLNNPNNTYAGSTFIACGTLTLGVNGALPSGTPLSLSTLTGAASTLTMGGFSQTIGPLQSLASLGGVAGTANPSINLTGALTIIQTNVSTAFSGLIKGAGGSLTITAAGGTPGVLTLSSNNSYTGPTTISGATLALAPSPGSVVGSINSTAKISIGAGGTFDVSALASPYNLSASTTLSASGAGTTPGSTAATINGAADGTVNLGSQAIALTYTPTSFTGDSSHPALYVSQGTLNLSGNVISVNNAGGTPLGAGAYVLIQAAAISGAPATSVVMSGSGLAAGATAAISVSGGQVILTVTSTAPLTRPVITSVTLTNNILTLTATNGTPGANFVLLETTNLTIPVTNWIPVLTNTFDGSGDISLSTNVVNTNNPVEFYIINNE